MTVQSVTCSVCSRNHNPDAPCPRRLARYYMNMMLPGALEKLTPVEVQWVKDHPAFSVIEVLEDSLADSI